MVALMALSEGGVGGGGGGIGGANSHTAKNGSDLWARNTGILSYTGLLSFPKIYLKIAWYNLTIFKYISHLIIVGTGAGAAGVVAGQAVQRVVGLALQNIFDSDNNPEYFIPDPGVGRGGLFCIWLPPYYKAK